MDSYQSAGENVCEISFSDSPRISDPVYQFYFILLQKNGTNDGVYEVHTGKDDPMQISNIISWRGMTHLDWWTTPQCNMLNGSGREYSGLY